MEKKMIDFAMTPAYVLIKTEEIPELNSTGYLLKHKKSGARLALLANDDKNKVFNIGFRTPPADDTGVAHIIEHTVLCGSRKYPPKDPFVELVKGSLNTFLNAMTFPDKTIFPVASCNDKDFENLVNVYMDAVFYPNIYKKCDIFRQEGWSYELEDKDDKLIYNGVVYNEMKGALSTPDSVMERMLDEELFPDTCYKYESGGDPEKIPDLTYEEFLAFHKKYYHPSNSYIYLYGDMDMTAYLNWMDKEYLSAYDAEVIDSEITKQKPFSEVKYVQREYPLGEEENSENKYMYAYSMATGDALDALNMYTVKILDYALISMPGAPVKQALIDAGVAKTVSGNYDNFQQTMMCITAKEAKEGKQEKFVQVIEDTLRKIVAQGIDKDSLKAALNVLEFQYREADFGSYPKGLFYGMDMLDSWLYDENEPFMHIKAGKTFEILNQKVETGYYEEFIREHLLENTHKVILTMIPKKGLSEEKEKETEKKLQEYKASLSESEIETIIADTKALKKYQSEPSTEEELKTIPMLKLEDIEELPQKFTLEERSIADRKVLFSEVPSNGIAYINVCFDAAYISEEELPYAALLRDVLADLDTEKYKYVELNNVINMHSGGFSNDLVQYGKKNGESLLLFENDIKVFYHELPFAFAIMEEILLHTSYADTKRIGEIISERRSKLRQKLISSGHNTAAARAGSYLTEAGCIKDIISGLGYYQFLEELENHYEEKKEEISKKLESTARHLFCREHLLMSFTSEAQGYEQMKAEFAAFVEKFPDAEKEEKRRQILPVKKNEALKIPASISYVARVGNFKMAGYEYTGAMDALRNILDYEYLWNNVRVKGGAYGVMSSYGANSGNVAFVSYRDPNVGKTNDIFNGIPEYLRTFEADEREMLKFIIGTISGKDTPRTPAAQGRRSFAAYLSDITYEDICKERKEILTLNEEKVRELAPVMEAVLSQNYICVVGNGEKIQESKDLFMEVKDLL